MQIQALRAALLNLHRGSSATDEFIPQYFKDSFTLAQYDQKGFPDFGS